MVFPWSFKIVSECTGPRGFIRLCRTAETTRSGGAEFRRQMALPRSGGRTRRCRALDAGPRPSLRAWATAARAARVGPPAPGAAGPTVRPSRNGRRGACAAGRARANGRVAHSAAGIYGGRPPRYRRPRPRPRDGAGLQPNPESSRTIIVSRAYRQSSGRGGRRGQVPRRHPDGVTRRGLPAPVRPARGPVCTADGSGRRQSENAPPARYSRYSSRVMLPKPAGEAHRTPSSRALSLSPSVAASRTVGAQLSMWLLTRAFFEFRRNRPFLYRTYRAVPTAVDRKNVFPNYW